jgi:hypothetical protein
MKWRWGEKPAPEAEERELEEEIRRQAAPGPLDSTPELPDAYWHNLIIRTNRRIDDATGAKAISLSWAARVAIPGVVAILSFLIGLRYYVPEQHPDQHSLADAVMSLPTHVVDSLAAVSPDSLAAGEVGAHLLDLSGDLAHAYVLENATSQDLMADLSEKEVGEILATLSTTEH